MRCRSSSQLTRSGRSSELPTVQRSLETTLFGSESTASTWCQATKSAKNPTNFLEMFVFWINCSFGRKTKRHLALTTSGNPSYIFIFAVVGISINCKRRIYLHFCTKVQMLNFEIPQVRHVPFKDLGDLKTAQHFYRYPTVLLSLVACFVCLLLVFFFFVCLSFCFLLRAFGSFTCGIEKDLPVGFRWEGILAVAASTTAKLLGSGAS